MLDSFFLTLTSNDKNHFNNIYDFLSKTLFSSFSLNDVKVVLSSFEEWSYWNLSKLRFADCQKWFHVKLIAKFFFCETVSTNRAILFNAEFVGTNFFVKTFYL